MPRAPRMTGLEVKRVIERDGWYEVDREGGHAQFKHPEKPGRVTISMHRGEILKPKTFASVLRQAKLSLEEFLELRAK